jgi:hypothetical protein
MIGLDPRTTPAKPPAAGLAPRPASLSGATIGVIGNGLNRGNDLLEAIVTEIARRVDIAGVVTITKKGVSVPPEPADWDRLVAGATVAITGYGGCGSCSSRSMRDAIELEAAQIPAAAVMHEALSGSARAMTRLCGMPGYPFAIVSDDYKSIASWADDEIEEIAAAVAPRVITLLTS